MRLLKQLATLELPIARGVAEFLSRHVPRRVICAEDTELHYLVTALERLVLAPTGLQLLHLLLAPLLSLCLGHRSPPKLVEAAVATWPGFQGSGVSRRAAGRCCFKGFRWL